MIIRPAHDAFLGFVAARFLGAVIPGLLLAVALGTCAHRQYVRVSDPVGPHPAGVRAGPVGVSTGFLVVYTDTDEVDRGDSGVYYPHSAYTLHDLRGRLLQRVENHRDAEDETPHVVLLAPGTYFVRAGGLGGWVEVTARVETGLTTEVRLDRSWTPAEDVNPNTLALADDGTPIGWHARAGSAVGTEGELRYEGSSTVATFVREAQSVFTLASFSIDDRGESAAGEVAALGTADIGGVARKIDNPPDELMCTVIGYDAIVAIVRADSPITGLTRRQLSGIFRGQIKNWSEVGGPQKPIIPLIVAEGSATRTVFREAVLEGQAYNALVASPDRDVINRVARSGSMIGQVSMALIAGDTRVRPIAIDGQMPAGENADYPVVRPLNLCIRRGATGPEREFVKWTLSEQGQGVLRRHFIGIEPKS